MKIFDWHKTDDGYYMYLMCTYVQRWGMCGRFNISSPEVVLPKIKRKQQL